MVCTMPAQLALFADPALPEGFRYQPDFLSRDEEAALIGRFAALPFQPFEFQQYLGKRRVVYLAPALLARLRELSAEYPEGTLFRTRTGRPWNRKAAAKAMRRLEEKSGVPKLSPSGLT